MPEKFEWVLDRDTEVWHRNAIQNDSYGNGSEHTAVCGHKVMCLMASFTGVADFPFETAEDAEEMTVDGAGVCLECVALGNGEI